MQRDWVIDIQRQCLAADVPFFFKQWGGVNKKRTGRDLDGLTYNDFPKKSLAVLASWRNHTHCKRQQSLHPGLTITDMYN